MQHMLYKKNMIMLEANIIYELLQIYFYQLMHRDGICHREKCLQ